MYTLDLSPDVRTPSDIGKVGENFFPGYLENSQPGFSIILDRNWRANTFKLFLGANSNSL